MRNALLALCLLLVTITAATESRFGRKVIKVAAHLRDVQRF